MAKQRHLHHLATFRGLAGQPFPIDMLRHDCCWPATNGDAELIEYTFKPGYRSRKLSVSITVRSEMDTPWSEERWESSVGLRRTKVNDIDLEDREVRLLFIIDAIETLGIEELEQLEFRIADRMQRIKPEVKK